MIAAYRAKMRRWAMDELPTMPEDQWEGLTRWIAAYGRNGFQEPRKRVIARMTEAKNHKPVRAEPNLCWYMEFKAIEARVIHQLTAPMKQYLANAISNPAGRMTVPPEQHGASNARTGPK